MSEQEQILLNRERNALERERLADERRQAVEEELRSLRSKRTLNWAVFGPILVAVIGATASVLATAVSQYYQSKNARLTAEQGLEVERASGEAELRAQREAAQQALILQSVTAEPSRADANLRFLVASGLIDTYAADIEAALQRGERLSIPTESQEVCGAPGCFVPPVVLYPGNREPDRIFGNYDGDEGVSHADDNARQFCIEKGYERAVDFDVSCSGEDESSYLSFFETAEKWGFIGTGSANSYCYPLIEWVRCR